MVLILVLSYAWDKKYIVIEERAGFASSFIRRTS